MSGIVMALPLALLFGCGPKNGEGADEPSGTDSEDPIESLEAQVNKALQEKQASGGGDTTTEVASTGTGGTGTGATDQPKPKGTGPAQLTLLCKTMGKEVPCDVQVNADEDGHKVDGGTGKTSYSFSLTAGTYQLQLSFDGAVDKPKLTLNGVALAAGETVERVVNFPMAEVKFVPVQAGTSKKLGGWKLRIKLKGATDWANENVKLDDYVYVSPGLYEGQLFKGSSKKESTIDISSIQVNEGAKSTVPINVSH